MAAPFSLPSRDSQGETGTLRQRVSSVTAARIASVPAEGFAIAKPLTPVGRKRPANVLCPKGEGSRKRV